MAHDQSNIFKETDRRVFLTYVGMETDLIFTQGIELLGFASFPLLLTSEGRDTLRKYFEEVISLGREHDLGIILESPTWVSSPRR